MFVERVLFAVGHEELIIMNINLQTHYQGDKPVAQRAHCTDSPAAPAATALAQQSRRSHTPTVIYLAQSITCNYPLSSIIQLVADLQKAVYSPIKVN